MQTVPFGSRGLAVSRQGLGCMGMSEVYGRGDDHESVATIHRVLERLAQVGVGKGDRYADMSRVER
jgi:aryl-alcohol dehydrogenase-like predicted oxidoreductase